MHFCLIYSFICSFIHSFIFYLKFSHTQRRRVREGEILCLVTPCAHTQYTQALRPGQWQEVRIQFKPHLGLRSQVFKSSSIAQDTYLQKACSKWRSQDFHLVIMIQDVDVPGAIWPLYQMLTSHTPYFKSSFQH